MSEENRSTEPSNEMDFDEKFEEKPQRGSHPRRRPSLFWPLLLIGGGVALLLNEFGYFQIESWTALWRYWPVLLILGGLDLLLGRRSILGSILGALLSLAIILGVIALVFSFEWVGDKKFIDLDEMGLQQQSIRTDLAGFEEADITLNLNRWETTITALDDSSNLMEGEIEYVGDLEFNTRDQNQRATVTLQVRNSSSDNFDWIFANDGAWEIYLSPKVVLDLELDAGSGSGDYDLSDLQLRTLTMDGGSGSFNLALPDERNMTIDIDAGSGSIELDLPERGTAELQLAGGSGSIRFSLAENMAVRLELKDGSGSLNVGERFELVKGDRDGDGVWETEGYGRAENRMVISIDQRSGNITFSPK